MRQAPDQARYDALRDLLDERWTCRQFFADEVPRPVIAQALALAQRTPSWCNTQPWHVEVTADRQTTAALAGALVAHVRSQNAPDPDFDFPRYSGLSLQRRRESGLALYRSLGIGRSDRERARAQGLRNFEFFGAPHVAIVTTDAELGTYGAVDCGLYVGSLLLALHSLGLGAAPQGALAAHAAFLRRYLGVPAGRSVVLGVAFGYPDVDHPVNRFRTSRAEVGEAVTWHQTT